MNELQGFPALPDFCDVGHYAKTPFNLVFSAASMEALDLLQSFLHYDPVRRTSAEAVSIIPATQWHSISRDTMFCRHCSTRTSPAPRRRPILRNYPRHVRRNGKRTNRASTQWVRSEKRNIMVEAPQPEDEWTSHNVSHSGMQLLSRDN